MFWEPQTERATYYRQVSRTASNGPNPREDAVYPVVCEFLSVHKNPPYRFVLYPQMSLKWKPEDPPDKRQEVTDFGVVNFTPNAYKLRCGIEVKRAIDIMANLPDARYIKNREDVKDVFHAAKIQAMDQAKAAFKNNYCFDSNKPIHWMLVVGPYWAPTQFGPFSEPELTVRSHKNSSSEDFEARMDLYVENCEPAPELKLLYRFDCRDSFDHIEQILEDTDSSACPLIRGILGRVCHRQSYISMAKTN